MRQNAIMRKYRATRCPKPVKTRDFCPSFSACQIPYRDSFSPTISYVAPVSQNPAGYAKMMGNYSSRFARKCANARFAPGKSNTFTGLGKGLGQTPSSDRLQRGLYPIGGRAPPGHASGRIGLIGLTARIIEQPARAGDRAHGRAFLGADPSPPPGDR